MTERKKGTGYDPSREELEFIYERIPQLSDGEILEEMKDVSFPVRKSGFIKKRRKELDAAKTVLREQVKKEIDPITIERKKAHYEVLASIASTLIENNLNTVTPTRENVTSPEYVIFEDRVHESPEYPISKEQLATTLNQNIEIAYTHYTTVTFHEQVLPHLIATIPDIATNELDSYSSKLSQKPSLLLITKSDFLSNKSERKKFAFLKPDLFVSIHDPKSLGLIKKLISQKLK